MMVVCLLPNSITTVTDAELICSGAYYIQRIRKKNNTHYIRGKRELFDLSTKVSRVVVPLSVLKQN